MFLLENVVSGKLSNSIRVADIDECTTDTDNCDANAVCDDNDGSFSCACKSGYNGDGTTCRSKQIDLEEVKRFWT